MDTMRYTKPTKATIPKPAATNSQAPEPLNWKSQVLLSFDTQSEYKIHELELLVLGISASYTREQKEMWRAERNVVGSKPLTHGQFLH
jgi:hypothetical protein